MKQFLENLGTGLLFFLLSCCSSCFGIAAYYGFVAISGTSGWTAIGLCLVSVAMVLMMGGLIYCMGIIHNDHKDAVNTLKRKIAELEEKEYEQV